MNILGDVWHFSLWKLLRKLWIVPQGKLDFFRSQSCCPLRFESNKLSHGTVISISPSSIFSFANIPVIIAISLLPSEEEEVVLLPSLEMKERISILGLT